MAQSPDASNPVGLPESTGSMPASTEERRGEGSGMRGHPTENLTLRYLGPAVSAFGDDMRKKLRQNEAKGGWENIPTGKLLELLVGELQELIEALNEGTPDEVRDECADVGNFAMMIHDNAGRNR